MARLLYTTSEKLAEVERAIRGAKFGHNDLDVDILKAVALDLRARLANAPTVALSIIESRVLSAKRARVNGGNYPPGPMIGIAEEIIGRFPVIKQALEMLDAKIEAERE